MTYERLNTSLIADLILSTIICTRTKSTIVSWSTLFLNIQCQWKLWSIIILFGGWFFAITEMELYCFAHISFPLWKTVLVFPESNTYRTYFRNVVNIKYSYLRNVVHHTYFCSVKQCQYFWSLVQYSYFWRKVHTVRVQLNICIARY